MYLLKVDDITHIIYPQSFGGKYITGCINNPRGETGQPFEGDEKDVNCPKCLDEINFDNDLERDRREYYEKSN